MKARAGTSPIDVGAVLRHLYSGEYHFTIEVFWDLGWEAYFGAPCGEAYTSHEGFRLFGSLDEAVVYLANEAIGHAADHESAQRWKCRMRALLRGES